MFALPVAGSQLQRNPLPWDPAQPYRGLGFRDIEAEVKDAEFKLTEESLLDEKAEHSLSWGEIVIAHTLLANSGTGLTIVDLAQLRREGLGWGAIAFGLQFHMEDFEDAIKAEGRVAMGLPKADGKAATIAK
jgi:hypothetical protein